MYTLSMVQYIKLAWKPKINRIFDKDQTNSQKQIKLAVAAIFLKNCYREIMIDQNGLKSHNEIMKCSFLENFEVSVCNFVTSLIPVLVWFHYFSYF